MQARIHIRDELAVRMGQDELEDYVKRQLSNEITSSVIKNMTIEKETSYDTLSTIFTGTINTGATKTYTHSNVSGPIQIDVQERFRVVEYTKNGKTSRVELQYFDTYKDEWHKVPRIKIEEE